MKALQPSLEIAELHANRISLPVDRIKNKIPVTAETINHLTPQELFSKGRGNIEYIT